MGDTSTICKKLLYWNPAIQTLQWVIHQLFVKGLKMGSLETHCKGYCEVQRGDVICESCESCEVRDQGALGALFYTVLFNNCCRYFDMNRIHTFSCMECDVFDQMLGSEKFQRDLG